MVRGVAFVVVASFAVLVREGRVLGSDEAVVECSTVSQAWVEWWHGDGKRQPSDIKYCKEPQQTQDKYTSREWWEKWQKNRKTEHKKRSLLVDIKEQSNPGHEEKGSTEAKLELVKDSLVFQELLADNSQIYPIVIYGKSGGGKSTMGNFLSCALDCQKGGLSFLSHANHNVQQRHGPDAEDGVTLGMWASPILTKTIHHGGTSVEKKFIIFDIEGADDSNHEHESRSEALVKLMAALTEVASVFLFASGGEVHNRQQSVLEHGDAHILSEAFKTTRASLLKTREYRTKKEKDDGDIVGATNKPRLFVMNRLHSTQEEEADAKNIDTNFLSGFGVYLSKNEYFMDQVKNNFEESEKSNSEGANSNSKVDEVAEYWKWAPVIDMTDSRYPWTFKKGLEARHMEDCRLYSEFEAITCKRRQGWESNSPILDSKPLIYKRLVDLMADQMFEHAVLREYEHKEGKKTYLTSSLLAEYLETVIVEMNSVDSLPKPVLWMRIYEEECEAAVKDLAEMTLGDSCSKAQDESSEQCGILYYLKPISDNLLKNSMDYKTEEASDKEEVNMKAAWANGNAKWAKKRTELFNDKNMNSNIKNKCESFADREFEIHKGKVDLKIAELLHTMKTLKVTHLVNERDELLKHIWWRENYLYAGAGGALGLVALMIITKICTVIKPVFDCVKLCCGIICPKYELSEPEGRFSVELTSANLKRRSNMSLEDEETMSTTMQDPIISGDAGMCRDEDP